MKQCPHCNAELPDEANVCLKCFTVPEKSIKSATNLHTARIIPYEKILVLTASVFVFIAALSFAAINGNRRVPEASSKTDASPHILSFIFSDKDTTNETEPSGEYNTESGTSDDVSSPQESDSSSNQISEESGESSSPGDNSDTTPFEDISNPGSATQSPNSPAEPIVTPPKTTTAPPEPEYDSFEYAPYNNGTKYYSITKYTGNSRNVTIPAKIDGKYVVEIASDAFKNNRKIETINFVTDSGQPYLWVESSCFNNLSSLNTISFPETDLGIVNGFAKSCTKLKQINITSRQYKFLNGGLYYYTSRDWKLRFYCPAYTGSTLTVPSWCAGVESSCNLNENPYLKVINMHADCTSFPSNYNTSKYLEAVNVDSANTHAFSKDGVLFCKDSNGKYSTSLYPPCKRDKVFKMPENVRLTVMSRAAANPYLEEIWVPASSSFDSYDQIFFNSAFSNLKTIYLQNGHSLTDKAKSTFTGNLYFY